MTAIVIGTIWWARETLPRSPALTPALTPNLCARPGVEQAVSKIQCGKVAVGFTELPGNPNDSSRLFTSSCSGLEGTIVSITAQRRSFR
jgi:hypothetical protein